MTIGSGFSRIFRPPFDAGAAATHWWLAPSGGVDTIPAVNCLAAYDAKNAASLALSYDNLAAPGNGLSDGTYDCTAIVAPTWANGTGWIGNGTQYLFTSISIPGDQTYSFVNRYVGVSDASYKRDGSANLWISPKYTPITQHAYRAGGSGGTVAKSGGVTTGVIGIAGRNCYLNGTNEGTAGVSTTTASNMYIFSNDAAGTTILTCTIVARAIYNISLSDTQMLNLYTAIAAL